MGYIGNGPYQGVLTGGNIQDGTVETTDLADGAITTVKINDGAVTAAKLASGAAVPDQSGQSGKYLTTDGSTASWGTVDLSTKVSKTGDTMTGDLIVNTSLGMGDRVMYDGDSSGAVKHFAMPKTTSRLSWGTPSGDNYRLNVSGGGALLFGVDSDDEYFAIETHKSGVAHNEKFRIDSYGRVTIPYQPAFHFYSGDADYTWGTASGVSAPASYRSPIPIPATGGGFKHNRGSHVSIVTTHPESGSSYGYVKFTAPVAGIYRFDARISMESQSAGDWLAVGLMKNSIATLTTGSMDMTFFDLINEDTVNSYQSRTGGFEMVLAANDYVVLTTQSARTVRAVYVEFSGRLSG